MYLGCIFAQQRWCCLQITTRAISAQFSPSRPNPNSVYLHLLLRPDQPPRYLNPGILESALKSTQAEAHGIGSSFLYRALVSGLEAVCVSDFVMLKVVLCFD
jgi:hypothetical protein